MGSYNEAFWPFVFQACLTIVLVFGLIGVAAGVGLIVSSARMFRFFEVMNRWISLRGTFRSAEIPRDTDQFAHKYRYWVGIPLIVCGLLSAFVLLFQIKGFALAPTLARGWMIPLLEIAAESLRWFLIVGSVFGVFVGIMLCAAADLLGSIEKYANRWVSPRRASRGADDMYPLLDNLIEAHPKRSGWIFACSGLGAVAYASFLLAQQ